MEYLVDADVLYAYMNPPDWLHNHAVKVVEKIKKGELKAKVSPIIILELAIVIKRDLSEKAMLRIYDKIKDLKVEILSVNEKTVEEAFKYLKKNMGIFDAYHAATAKTYNLTIIGTDQKYDKVGVKRLDPRQL